MILAIDFDGVLHDFKHPVEGRRMGPPMTGAKEKMVALKNAGHELIVHTVWEPKSWPTITAWLAYYAIPYDLVTNVKPNADIYLDDKAVRFTSWSEFNA